MVKCRLWLCELWASSCEGRADRWRVWTCDLQHIIGTVHDLWLWLQEWVLLKYIIIKNMYKIFLLISREISHDWCQKKELFLIIRPCSDSGNRKKTMGIINSCSEYVMLYWLSSKGFYGGEGEWGGSLTIHLQSFDVS